MRQELSSGQIDSYRRDGFLVIDGFLDRDQLEDWREAVDEAIAQRLAEGGRLQNQDDPNSYYARVFTQCLRLADSHAGVRKLIYDVRIARMAATLAGTDGIRVWHDQALVKPPFGNPTAWHLDNPYWSFTDPRSISVWIALDDATLANGCMWYLPGTHTSARQENVSISENISSIFDAYPEWRSIESVGCPCQAGSAVFHSGWVAHGAGANMTNRPRRAMTCAFMPDGATFNGNQNILPIEMYESMTVGQKLEDPGFNPLVWSKERDG